MSVGSEILYHLEQDVKQLFSVSGKLALSSDLSPNLSDTRSAAKVESTWKLEQILTLIKPHFVAKITLLWI